MKAIILAAGAGERLLPLSLRKPKALIKINGAPLIEHQIRGYLKAGVEMASIYVVSGYRYDQIEGFIALNYPQVQLVKNERYRSTNSMYSLYLGLQCIEGSDAEEGLFVSNGDCIYDDDIMERLSSARGNCIVGDTSEHNDGPMKVIVEHGRVTNIGQTISQEDASAVSIDLYKLDFRAITKLSDIAQDYIFKKREVNLWSEVALKDLLQTERFSLLDIAGAKWAEIYTTSDLLAADKRFSHLDLKKKQCFITDLDGTVYVGDRPILGTIAFINENANHKDFYFVSNNTSKVPDEYLAKLNAMGIHADCDHILTPLTPLISYLKDVNIRNVYLLANAKVTEYLQKALPELTLTAETSVCEALIVAYDTELTYEKLKNAALLLQRNPRLPFLATHCDLVCPTEHGFVPDSGCILSVLELTTGRRPTMIFGKPNPLLIEAIKNRYQLSQMAVVGDRLYTDNQMAQNVGCDFICVLSGETTREQIENLSESEVPSLVVQDLGTLLT
jgi:HAD superfamily hydrolase (TIGR01450 family)